MNQLFDSGLKNKPIAHCPELPFGITFSSRYVNIETMNIISSDVKINKFLAITKVIYFTAV